MLQITGTHLSISTACVPATGNISRQPDHTIEAMGGSFSRRVAIAAHLIVRSDLSRQEGLRILARETDFGAGVAKVNFH
jgi:hypothetical protein